jgi:hypothetical protein
MSRSALQDGIDPMAVVDPRLPVLGVTGLRVIDASIMPAVTTGNTNAPTIMIGEKGAAIIQEDARTAAASRRDVTFVHGFLTETAGRARILLCRRRPSDSIAPDLQWGQA